MSKLVKIAKNFFGKKEEGATMIEYGLLAALVSIAALAALQALGPRLLAIFNSVVAALAGA
jgi:pilus assembly protein Flp/PilA